MIKQNLQKQKMVNPSARHIEISISRPIEHRPRGKIPTT
jgi:hypothetical protein